MTIWDSIYKKHQKGGVAWTTLAEEVHPLFKQFLNQSSFEHKYVLDIGCGTGKYLKFLSSNGFKTDGIDSSKTAIEMTKEILENESKIFYHDMFTFKIPKNRYDLVLSISTIQHGTKDQIQKLINKIHETIIKDGKIFITVPSFENCKKWHTFDDREKIEKGTFIPLSGPEKGLPHSFYTKKETQALFSEFKNLKLDQDEIGRWIVRASK